uniref:Uncharacterized protein n=1 Tax=uncultured alpha proteobacterium EB080_L84F03 TaxID=711004 RepID=E0Y1K4_9PROT|nr:hypothetical protein [uncultured alpha proteobacterium EB080_L84F03]
MAIVLSQMRGRGGFELSTYSLNECLDMFSPDFSKPHSDDKNILETMY